MKARITQLVEFDRDDYSDCDDDDSLKDIVLESFLDGELEVTEDATIELLPE